LGEVGDLGDERRGQVVDGEPAEVLERAARLGAPAAREARDDDVFAHRVRAYVERSRSQWRKSSRGIERASRYSGASARKPGGGGGSSISRMIRPDATRALT